MTLTYTQSCPATQYRQSIKVCHRVKDGRGVALPQESNRLQYRLRSSLLYHAVTDNQRILVRCLCRPRPYRLCIGTLAFGGVYASHGMTKLCISKNRSLFLQKYVIKGNAETLAYVFIIYPLLNLSLNCQFNGHGVYCSGNVIVEERLKPTLVE